MKLTLRECAFLLAAAACLLPWVSPPIALALGLVFALAGLSAFGAQSKKLSRLLIQICIVLLGLRINLGELAKEAQNGLLLAAATIVGAFAFGWLLGKLFKTGTELTLLVSSGTAICGGSAIAAMGSAIGANASSMAVATGAIFILNAIALYTFIPIGHLLDLSAAQFGAWAGVAIHDMSSVSGAGKAYVDSAGNSALDTATIVKLSRVIWILPCTLFGAYVMSVVRPRISRDAEQSNNNITLWRRVVSIFPVFILWFVVASAIRTFVPAVGGWEATVKTIAGAGFSLALFLIGSGLSVKALREVGWRVLAQACILWIVLAAASLAYIVYYVDP